MAIELRTETTRAVSKGTPQPLGATVTATGVNFAVYSKYASDVFLLLFASDEGQPSDVIQLSNRARTRSAWGTSSLS